MAASKSAQNNISVAIGIGIAIAVAIGYMSLQKPIATAIATATPIPIPMITTQSKLDLSPDPYFLIKCPTIYELNVMRNVQDRQTPRGTIGDGSKSAFNRRNFKTGVAAKGH